MSTLGVIKRRRVGKRIAVEPCVVVGEKRCSSFVEISSTLNSSLSVQVPALEESATCNYSVVDPPSDVEDNQVEENVRDVVVSEILCEDAFGLSNQSKISIIDERDNSEIHDLGFATFNEVEFDHEMRDTSVPLEEIPSREFADLLCKFFYVLLKKNGKHYPNQFVMQIYKGFNRIFCKV